ncbi:MAG TPA: CoA-binding protein [Conexibacter sp.]|jgi:succinyl-CoA synthetase alpha subunit
MSSLFADAGASVVIQGITGRAASRHARHMQDYGTNVVAGVAPGRAGRVVDGIPVFDTVVAAREATGATTSVAFLPTGAVGDGVAEAADAGISLLVCLTEGVPLHDVVKGLEVARDNEMRVVGPNCPGMVSAGRYLLGFLPVEKMPVGGTAVLSRSGTLSYEAVHALGRDGLGVSLWIGVGGDRVKGSSFSTLLPDVLADERTDSLVIIGEIGGTDEEDLAVLLDGIELPVVALLAGSSAPEGVSLGHAGAIVEGGRGTYAAKRASLEAAGVTVVTRPSEIASSIKAKALA